MTTPMSTSLIPPEAGAGEIARNEMQSRLAGLGNLGSKNMDPAQKEKKLRESCEGFESIFIQKMWEEMRKTLPKSTLLHGKEEQFWQGMYDQELAKKMTSAGGIGLADMMYAQLSRGLASASRTTATDASGAGQPAFTPEAAPMLTRANTAESEAQGNAADAAGRSRASGPAASVYGGVAPTHDDGLVANGSAAARTLTGDQAAADGQNPEEAARNAQLAMQASAQPERHKVVRTSNVPNMNSGLNLARMAQFEAGSKLGSNTVRPSMQQMMGLAQQQNRPGQVPGQNSGQPAEGAGFEQAAAPAPMPNMEIPPLMGSTLDAQMAMQAAMQPAQAQTQAQPQPQAAVAGQGQAQAQAAMQPPQGQAGMPAQSQPQKPQPTKVRFTTNVPPAGRGGKQGLIRTLNTDGSGPNSNAGAGIAAYHAQQAQQAQPGGAQSAAGAQPTAQVSPLPMGPAGQPAALVANPQASQPASSRPGQAATTGTPMQAQGGTPAATPGMVSPVPLTGGQISVRQSNKNAANQGAAATGIPPLTSTDVYGKQ